MLLLLLVLPVLLPCRDSVEGSEADLLLGGSPGSDRTFMSTRDKVRVEGGREGGGGLWGVGLNCCWFAGGAGYCTGCCTAYPIGASHDVKWHLQNCKTLQYLALLPTCPPLRRRGCRSWLPGPSRAWLSLP